MIAYIYILLFVKRTVLSNVLHRYICSSGCVSKMLFLWGNARLFSLLMEFSLSVSVKCSYSGIIQCKVLLSSFYMEGPVDHADELCLPLSARWEVRQSFLGGKKKLSWGSGVFNIFDPRTAGGFGSLGNVCFPYINLYLNQGSSHKGKGSQEHSHSHPL